MGKTTEIAKPKARRREHERGLQTCKFCLKCLCWRPLCEFYTDRAKADGLASYCSPCASGQDYETWLASERGQVMHSYRPWWTKR